MGAQYGHLVKTRFESADGKHVCVVDIEKAPEPVFVKSPAASQ